MWQNDQFQSIHGLGRIAVTSFLLGILLSIHLCFLIYSFSQLDSIYSSANNRIINYIRWSTYFSCLIFFHFSEFISTAMFKPSILSYDSFLINHSKEYTIACLFSWFEFWIEIFFFSSIKIQYISTFFIGLCVLFMGQFIRIAAMWTAKSNFSHRIEMIKRKDHELVTYGIYKYIRHPAYCGWFYWCLGTQLILGNPISFIVYTIASWNFFKDRIPYEEMTLIVFFKKDYIEYKKNTISGVPFI